MAHLTRSRDDGISFDYLEDAAPRARSGAIGRLVAAAWSGTYPVVTKGPAVPAFFAGLLPRGGSPQRRFFKRSATDTPPMII